MLLKILRGFRMLGAIIAGCDRADGCIGACAACASTISSQFLVANSGVLSPLSVFSRFCYHLFFTIFLFYFRWLLLTPALPFFTFFI